MSRRPLPTFYFALVVVRDGDRFLVVHERKHGARWYLPAGRVEPGETLAEGALRETLEESGVEVELLGLFRLEHTPYPDGDARVRAFFLARPKPGATPLSAPNDHSLGARFVTLEEARTLPLRDAEVLTLFAYAATDPPLLPLSAIAREG